MDAREGLTLKRDCLDLFPKGMMRKLSGASGDGSGADVGTGVGAGVGSGVGGFRGVGVCD